MVWPAPKSFVAKAALRLLVTSVGMFLGVPVMMLVLIQLLFIKTVPEDQLSPDPIETNGLRDEVGGN